MSSGPEQLATTLHSFIPSKSCRLECYTHFITGRMSRDTRSCRTHDEISQNAKELNIIGLPPYTSSLKLFNLPPTHREYLPSCPLNPYSKTTRLRVMHIDIPRLLIRQHPTRHTLKFTPLNNLNCTHQVILIVGSDAQHPSELSVG